jgi:hypothetical protein
MLAPQSESPEEHRPRMVNELLRARLNEATGAGGARRTFAGAARGRSKGCDLIGIKAALLLFCTKS